MQYTITLQRLKEYENIAKPPKGTKIYRAEDSTLGSFTIRDEDNEQIFKCYCVENTGPSTDEPLLDRRIVARNYKLYYTESNVSLPEEHKPKCISLYTHELPSFKDRRIHIHIGNYPQDTEGCLLLCYTDNGNGTGGRSTDAVRDFYNLIDRLGIDNFTLIVKEIQNA